MEEVNFPLTVQVVMNNEHDLNAFRCIMLNAPRKISSEDKSVYANAEMMACDIMKKLNGFR